MILSFTSLVIKNFGSFLGEHELDLASFGQGLHFVRGDNQDEPRLQGNGCLVGSTLIDCPRDLKKHPKGIPIKDLVGKQFLTYSWNFKKDTLVLSKVADVWCTGRKKIYRVTLSAFPDGRNSMGIRGRKGFTKKGGGKYLAPCELIGTYDHPVMLCDGTWKKLGELEPGDSLKSLYRREADRGKISWSKNVKKKTGNKYYGLTKAVVEQQFVCEAVNGPRPKKAHSHHKDENEHNHYPSNLEWKSASDHASHHARERNLKGEFGWQLHGVHPKGMLGKTHKESTKKQIGETGKTHWNDQRRANHKKQWLDKQDPRLNDPIWLKEQYATRSAIDIAFELGCTAQTVYCRLKTYGIKARSNWQRAPNHKVESVKFQGYEDVYDMEVEGTHNFVANGVFVHNSGKSTVFNALCWCLYGRTPDGRRNPDIEPRFGAKATTVLLDILIDDKPHTVIRTTHPNKLLLDDKEVGQEQIDQLVGLSFEVATHTLILGQGRPLFFDLQPKGKMDLFVSVLNLDRWDARADYAAEQARLLQTKEATLVGELNGLEAQETQLKTLLEIAKENWVNWRDEQDREAKEAKQNLVKLKAQCEKLEVERAGYDLAFDGAATELKALKDKNRQLAAEGEKLVLDRSPITAQVATHKEKARSLRAELEALGDAEECPTCGQSLKGTNLSKHKAELKRQLEVAARKLASVTSSRDALIEKWNAFQVVLERSRKHESQFQDKVNANQNALIGLAPQLANLNAQIAQLEANAKKKQVEANPYTDQVTELKRKIKKLDTDYQELNERLTKLSEQIERTKFWVKGFKEVRLYIIEDVLQELELTTNAALADVGLIDWQVQYSVEKETKSGTIQRGLNVMIQSPRDKAPVKWECWSGGEGQRLRLVGALALSEVLLSRAGVSAKMEVLDEPTRGLSPTGIIDLCEFLGDRAKQLGSQIWYCDHASVESVRFTSVLTVVKIAKGSELVT